MTRKPVILVSMPHYLPGNKFGGPTRTIANMVEALGDEMEFRIVTSDRDFGDTAPYPDLARDAWQRVGKGWVRYTSAKTLGVVAWRALLKETPHDVLYLNSLLSPRFSLWPLIAAVSTDPPRSSVVLAPRGELSPGALALKRRKKSIFLALAKWVGFYRGVVWHASTQDEAELIRGRFGGASRVVIARNLPTIFAHGGETAQADEYDGTLKLVFLSRISRMKNLDYALKVLARSARPLRFDIWGPIEDADYWEECRALLRALPRHVEARYRGVADHANVGAIFAGYDLLFLPTRGENFGHVIAEAISVGVPALLSDRTPWRGLREHGVGWDLPLDDGEAAFAEALEQAHVLVAGDRNGWRRRVREYAKEQLVASGDVEANRQVFLSALSTT